MKKIFVILCAIFILSCMTFTSNAESLFPMLKEKNIISSDKVPEKKITRGEFTVILAKAFNFTDGNTDVPFVDVDKTSSDYKYFSAAYTAGWLKGDEYGNMNPKHPLTRAEASAMIGRIANAEEKNTPKFKDSKKIPEWAEKYISGLQNLDIIHGHTDGNFKPNDNLTFHEACIIVENALKNSFEKGNGSKENPFVITKPFHFLNIKLYPDKNFVLADNLYFTDDVIFDSIPDFSGTLDGKGYKITALKTTASNKQTIFENLSGKIQNLNMVCTDTFVSFAKINNGEIRYCGNSSFNYDENKNYFTDNNAGICVINNGLIYGCYNSSYLPGTKTTVAAGITYTNNGIVSNSLNTATGSGKTAGISYNGNGIVEFSLNTGDVSFPINYSGNIKSSYYSNYGNFKNGTFKSPSSVYQFVNKEEFEYNRTHNIPTLKNILYIDKENFSDFSGGDGSVNNPFNISNATEFMNIEKFKNAYFNQLSDIDMSGINNYSPVAEFTGNYNGNGHSILNLHLTESNTKNTTLFVHNKGTVTNLNLKNCYFEGNTVAGFAIKNSGSIKNLSSDGYIKGEICAGLVITNDGYIETSCFSGSVTGTETSAGICITNNDTISNCLSDAVVFGKSAIGLVKTNNGNITQCCFFGELHSNAPYALCLNNNSNVTNCYYKSGYVSNGINKGNISAYSRTENQAVILSAFDKLDTANWKSGECYPILKFMDKDFDFPENFSDFAGGNGSLKNPYRIVSPLQFENIRKYPADAFVLINDVDMSLLTKSGGNFYNSGKGFIPFEDFSGVLFGNGKKLSGFNIKSENAAVFMKNRGIITNLITDKMSLNGKNTAGLVINNYGSISLCLNNSNLRSENNAGIALFNFGKIYECINNGNLKGNCSAGIALFENGEVKNSLNTGSISGTDNSFKISGITLEGYAETSLNTGDIYAYSGFGEIFPISQNESNFSYYLNRYNLNYEGKISLKELLTKESLKEFDFDSVWVYQDAIPTLKNLKHNNINLPDAFSGGNGTSANPYIIKNIQDLHNIRMYPDCSFVLANDIIFDKKEISIANQYEKGFIPVSDFRGVLDGAGFTIYGLEILNKDGLNSGIFEVNNGTVKNLSLNRATIKGKENAGGICGQNKGLIENVAIIGSRIGSFSSAGGIAGENSGKVINCFNSSDIFADVYAGGICGINKESVLKCTSTGGVIASSLNSSAGAGGIAGYLNGKIVECENNGKVISYSENFESVAGGIAGLSKGSISDSFNTGDITSKGKNKSYSGGITGKSENKIIISSCYNIGYCTSMSENAYLGSVCASGNGSITKTCYDETLAAPVQEGKFTYTKVYPITSNDFIYDKWVSFLGDDIWINTKSEDYPYPQLINNPHRKQILSDNILDFAGGNGSKENPYLIMTASQLDNVRYYLGSCFELLADIDVSSYEKKNGFGSIGEDMFAFFGVFLGSDKTLSGFNGDTGELFSVNHGDIYDLTIDNSVLGIADSNTGTIYHCFVKNTNRTEKNVDNVLTGGICNTNYSSGMIISSRFHGNIKVDSQSVQAGGIVSGNYGYILGCEFDGDISVSANNYAITGGLAAFSYGTISDCLGKGKISANCPTQNISGSLVGTLGGTIINSVAYDETETDITGTAVTGQVVNCYYQGSNSSEHGIKINSDTNFEGFDFETMWHLDENGKIQLNY